MGCAESRNTVQPHGAFSAVTPGSSTNTNAASTAIITTSSSNRFFHRHANNGPATQKKHKPNALVPEPQGPTVPPETAIRPPPTAPPGSSGPPSPNARSTPPSVAAIANPKPPSTTPSSPSSSPPPLVSGPSLLLLPSDKQNLTLEELSIQFLKAVKNGDLAYMESVAQQAAKAHNNVNSSNAPSGPPLINIRGMWESTPLIYACQYCHPKAAMWLLEHGANVHLENEKGVTPLLLASLEGMADVVDWVLKQYTDRVGDSIAPETSADAAVSVSIDKQVGVVYNSAADLNIRLNPLLAAAMNGHMDIVAKLLAHKASVNCGVPASASVASSKQFALLLAAKYGRASVVRILIKHGADFATSDATGNHALLLACEASKEECAMELLRLLPATPGLPASLDKENEADKDQSSPVSPRSNSYVTAWKQANAHGLTALHFAAANGLFSVVQSMLVRLQWGDDREFLNATSVNRRECALLMACRKRQSEVVQLLVSIGADFELADRGGTTALQVLKRDKKDELIKLCESRKLRGGGHHQQQQQQQQSSRTVTVRGGGLQAKSGDRQSEKHKEERGGRGSGRSSGETATMMTELAIDVTENQEMLLLDVQEQLDEKKATPAPAAAEIAKSSTTFDWDAALEPVISTTMLPGGGGDNSDGTSAALAHEPSSRLKSMVRSGSSRTMSFSPNAVRSTNGYDQKQQEETKPDSQPASSRRALEEDKGAARIKTNSANGVELDTAGHKEEETPRKQGDGQPMTRTESAAPSSLVTAVEDPPGDAEGKDEGADDVVSPHRKKEAAHSKPKHRKREHSPKKSKRQEAADVEEEAGNGGEPSRTASTLGVVSHVNSVASSEEEGRATAASFSHASAQHSQGHHKVTADGGGDEAQMKAQRLQSDSGDAEASNPLKLPARTEVENGPQEHHEDRTNAESSAIATDDWDEPPPANLSSGEPAMSSSPIVKTAAPALEPLPPIPALPPMESEDAPSSPRKERRKKKKSSSHASKKSKQSAPTASASSLEIHAESTSPASSSAQPQPSLSALAATVEGSLALEDDDF